MQKRKVTLEPRADHIEQLVGHFSRATDTDIKEGMAWYANARRHCLSIATRYNLPLWRVVGVLASLSPRNKWTRNKQDTEALIALREHAVVATFNANKRLALHILENAVNADHALSLLGPKTGAFYKNILYSKDDSVTVDVWALYSVGLDANSVTASEKERVALAYKVVAKQFKLIPSQLQAIIWCVVRKAHA